LGQFSKNYRTFYQKNCQKALKNMVLGSGIRKKPIPDPGSRGQKAPDPGSGSATLPTIYMLHTYSDRGRGEGGGELIREKVRGAT
jgi:hypothetical protein